MDASPPSVCLEDDDVTPLKVLGVVAGTLFAAAVVGGGIYWWRKTKGSIAPRRRQVVI